MTNQRYTAEDARMGGPGLDGYIYRAAVYCPDCAAKLIEYAFASGKVQAEDGTMDGLDFNNSEVCPCPVFFGEHDVAQHCDDCGTYLYGGE